MSKSLKEYEEDFLLSKARKSVDENISQSLYNLLTVTKLVYSEELETFLHQKQAFMNSKRPNDISIINEHHNKLLEQKNKNIKIKKILTFWFS